MLARSSDSPQIVSWLNESASSLQIIYFEANFWSKPKYSLQPSKSATFAGRTQPMYPANPLTAVDCGVVDCAYVEAVSCRYSLDKTLLSNLD